MCLLLVLVLNWFFIHPFNWMSKRLKTTTEVCVCVFFIGQPLSVWSIIKLCWSIFNFESPNLNTVIQALKHTRLISCRNLIALLWQIFVLFLISRALEIIKISKLMFTVYYGKQWHRILNVSHSFLYFFAHFSTLCNLSLYFSSLLIYSFNYLKLHLVIN